MSDAGSSIAAASEPIYSQPFLHNHAGLQVGVSGGGGHGSTRYKLTFFHKTPITPDFNFGRKSTARLRA